MHRCAVDNTVVGTVASASFAAPLTRFAAAAQSGGGFNCTVVSAFDHFDALGRDPLLYPLPQPRPPLLPSSLWCNASVQAGNTLVKRPAPELYGWRRSHLYRVRLWRVVLEYGFHLLAIDVRS